MRVRRRGRVEDILLVTGAALVLYWGGYRAWAEYGRGQQVAAFHAADQPDTSLWSANRIRAYEASIAAGGELPLGTLTIPNGLEIPIYAGATDANLDRGVAWIEGTDGFADDGGNMGIAGHRDGFFRSLKDVRFGDRLAVTTAGGRRIYEVTDLAVVDSHDASPLGATYATALTLVTCYPFYFVGNAPQRYIVRADAVAFESRYNNPR